MVAKKKSSTKSSKSKKKTLDQQILQLLDTQKNHILLSHEIANELGTESSEITLAIRRLKENSKIRTKLVMDDSRWITQVKKIHDIDADGKSSSAENLVWEPFNDLPCYICPFTRKCDEGQKQYNPRTCAWLTDWLLCCVNDEKYAANPFHPEYEVEKKKKKK